MTPSAAQAHAAEAADVSGLLPVARLPAWCLPADWPRLHGEVAPARLAWRAGRIESVTPVVRTPNAAGGQAPGAQGPWVMPTLVQAHAHLDKAFTASRARARGPGLLAAIDATREDRQHWSAADVRARMTQGLQSAWAAGVSVLRTHIDWPDAQPPLAWHISLELAAEWRGRIQLESVALVPLRFFAEPAMADAIGARVSGRENGREGGHGSAPGTRTVLGGFIHTSNWNPEALAHLMKAALDHQLDLDLHIDEELDPRARGVATAVRLAQEMRLETVITCSHACALAAQPRDEALATLDAMARLPRPRLVTLPSTNLLLQDARTGETPLRRGITLVHEAHARGIPVLVGSDNVQDPFCRGGSLDPLEAFFLAVHAAQLESPFDTWSDAIARPDALSRSPVAHPLAEGASADLVCFEPQAGRAWPDLSAHRHILRGGSWLPKPHGEPPHAPMITAHHETP